MYITDIPCHVYVRDVYMYKYITDVCYMYVYISDVPSHLSRNGSVGMLAERESNAMGL